jgi:hypothetical protein
MRDLRKYARHTNARLVGGAILLVFTLGLGLIYIIYGQNSALAGLICLLVTFIPIILIVFFLRIIEKLVERANQD